MYCYLISSFLFVLPSSAGLALRPALSDLARLELLQAQPAPSQLDTFQVYQPVSSPKTSNNQYGCVYTTVLMKHDFGNSYGSPFVGNYTPPPCSFNRVIMNLTVTSQGVQFDRLAIVYLGDVEIFRTSTAEPTQSGIIWNYAKEMHMYNALWREPQVIIYDEPNIVNDFYTGLFNTTLTATFFTVPDSPATPDLILPITSKQSALGKGSVFNLPEQNATVNYTLPLNTNRAVISLSATGQINEEFWYANAPTSLVKTFADTTGTMVGGGTFREVQLYIDEHLSGVSWPFPVIFTGGIMPGFWRPVVGIDAFDLKQHEIDITPWLGYLLDGKSHTFAIRVASVDDDGQNHVTLAGTPSFWLVTGTIFLYQDPTGFVTKGTHPSIKTPVIDISFFSSFTQDPVGLNESLTYTTTASRFIQITSLLNFATGPAVVSWTQELSYTNTNELTSYGVTQYTQQTIKGKDVSFGPSRGRSFSSSYEFPLTLKTTAIASSDGSILSIRGSITHGKSLVTYGDPVFPPRSGNLTTNDTSLQTQPEAEAKLRPHVVVPKFDTTPEQALPNLQGTNLTTTQISSASYFRSPHSSYSFGSTEQYFSIEDLGDGIGRKNVELYHRHVKAVNNSIIFDDQTPSCDLSSKASLYPAAGPLIIQDGHNRP